MTKRLAYQSFGESAYNPAGVLYWQVPDELMGKLPVALQIALRALLKLWKGRTQTDATRKQLIDELPEEKSGITLRSVTGWFSRLVAMGVIKRERIQGTNVWITTLTMPFQARLNEPVDAAALAAAPKTFTTSTAEEPAPIEPRLEDGNVADHIVNTWLPNEGWKPELDEQHKFGFRLTALEPNPIPLSAGLRIALERYADAIRAFLEANRPALE